MEGWNLPYVALYPNCEFLKELNYHSQLVRIMGYVPIVMICEEMTARSLGKSSSVIFNKGKALRIINSADSSSSGKLSAYLYVTSSFFMFGRSFR